MQCYFWNLWQIWTEPDFPEVGEGATDLVLCWGSVFHILSTACRKPHCNKQIPRHAYALVTIHSKAIAQHRAPAWRAKDEGTTSPQTGVVYRTLRACQQLWSKLYSQPPVVHLTVSKTGSVLLEGGSARIRTDMKEVRMITGKYIKMKGKILQ